MLGSPWGLAALVSGWMVLAITDRRLLVVALVLTVPLTTFGWGIEIFEIAGRRLDIRLAVTFAVAAIALVTLATSKNWKPSVIEYLFGGFIGWSIVSGVLAADSYLTWGPPVARAVAYGSVFALARQHLRGASSLAVTMGAMTVGFAIPSVAGLAQYAMGNAQFINEAARATAPGGRGPISLAFDGQIVLLLSFALLSTAKRLRRSRTGWLGLALLGAMAVLASATRLASITSWACLALFSALRRSWASLVLVTVLFVAALVIRPDLVGRFTGTVTQPPSSPSQSQPAQSPAPGGAEADVEVDPSLRFRFFVWSTILSEWTKHPWTGIGPGMTARVVEQHSSASRAAPHNDYVGVFAELSVPGIAIFVAVQCAVLLSLYKLVQRSQDPERGLLMMSGLTFLTINVVGVLNNPMYFFDVQVGLWAVVGAAASHLEGAENNT